MSKDGTISGPDLVKQEVFEARFRVEFLAWKLAGNKLIIFRGAEKTISDITEDKEYVRFHELSWKRATKLEFFKLLFKETGRNFVEQQK